MTDKELMQQALEALENAEDQLAKPYSTEAGYAIAALRERLARQEEHTTRIITDAHGRKHITNEPLLRG